MNYVRTFTAMKITLLLSASFVILSSFSDPSSTDIEWAAYRSLSWEDFKGVADENSHGDASTSIRISAKPYLKRGKIFYDVNAFFLPEKSWYKNKSENLLAHEQLHFDLAELYARKVRYLISDYRKMGVKDHKKYHAAIQQLLNESNRIDQQYDYETLHGSLKAKQASWERTIRLELAILSQYSKANWR